MRLPEVALTCVAAACAPACAESFDQLAARCAPDVHPQTLRKLATVESFGNPFAIGIVGGALARQPASAQEALATIREMVAQDLNFSVGVVQINRYNVSKYGQSFDTILEPCANVHIGAEILKTCFQRAPGPDEQQRLFAALSCYYSGNFRRGFEADKPGGTSYVQRVAASTGDMPRYVVPAVQSEPPPAAPPRTNLPPVPKPASPWVVFLDAQQPAPAEEQPVRAAPAKPQAEPRKPTPLFQTVGDNP